MHGDDGVYDGKSGDNDGSYGCMVLMVFMKVNGDSYDSDGNSDDGDTGMMTVAWC